MEEKTISGSRAVTEKPDIRRFQIHTHDEYEVYCFLRGKAKYFVEGTVYPLHPGDILVMKKAESHTLLLLKDAPYERIAIHFFADAIEGSRKEAILRFLNERPLGKNNRYPASVFKGNSWIHYMNTICESKDPAIGKLYLTVLLSELCDSSGNIQPEDEARDNISEVIAYINSHLDEDLSIDSICAIFHTSRSHTSRKFRQMTGSPMGEYIRMKRLLMAKERLESGENPYSVYEKCGFNEYCSFYRAYKEKFGVSPKSDYQKGN